MIFCIFFVFPPQILDLKIARLTDISYGSLVTSNYLVEEVSGSCPGRVKLKTLKIVPTAALFGAEHIRVRVVTIIPFSRYDLQGMD